MKITGLKKAVEDYRRLNAGGPYDPTYGILMFDTSDGRLWTDEFYSLGHNSYKEYESKTIVNLSRMMLDEMMFVGEYEINMKTVKNFIEKEFEN